MNSSITHKDLQQRMAEGIPQGNSDEPTVRRLWWAALDTLQYDLLPSTEAVKGLWLASPLPALYEPRLLGLLNGWVWAPDELESLSFLERSLLPPSRVSAIKGHSSFGAVSYNRLPLRKEDGNDPLLLLITPEMQVALALQGKEGQRQLIMRSDPETLTDLLRLLDLRLDSENPGQAQMLRNELAGVGQLSVNSHIDQLFWPKLAERLATMAPSLALEPLQEISNRSSENTDSSMELRLLEALTHEVRTPLATIRTLIRSLLRRNDLPEKVVDRLQQIDDECTEQIARFGLIFNAAELQREPRDSSRLARTDLGNMLRVLSPAWRQQLERRGISLDLDIALDLPQVLSDPERLEPMLGGLVDRSSRGLSSGGTLTLQLRVAGSRLKLQIIGHSLDAESSGRTMIEKNSELGPVLSWNPSTGSLQLSQAATQKLLASLGGWLTQRRDSRLTVFFPIAEGNC